LDVLAEGHGERLGWYDPDEQRFWVREHKPRDLHDKRLSMAEAVERFVPDGALLAMGGFGHVRVSMAAVYEMIRQGKRSLALIGKTATHDADLAIAAGCRRATWSSSRSRDSVSSATKWWTAPTGE